MNATRARIFVSPVPETVPVTEDTWSIHEYVIRWSSMHYHTHLGKEISPGKEFSLALTVSVLFFCTLSSLDHCGCFLFAHPWVFTVDLSCCNRRSRGAPFKTHPSVLKMLRIPSRVLLNTDAILSCLPLLFPSDPTDKCLPFFFQMYLSVISCFLPSQPLPSPSFIISALVLTFLHTLCIWSL